MARLDALFCSVTNHTKLAFDFVVSDYGSSEPYRSQLVALASQRGFRVVRSEAQGLPWSRARAINTGVRQAQTPLVAVLDVDMVIHDNVFDHVASVIGPTDVYFLESIWPQSARANPLKGVVNRSYGVFHVLHTDWFSRLHGFCEAIQFWGGEDNDWVRRLTRAGAQIHWLETKDFKLTHTWHAWDNNPVTRPFTAVVDTLHYEMANLVTEYRNENWGKALRTEDRPILAALSRESVDFELGNGTLMSRVPEVVEAFRSGRLVKIVFGDRISPRRFTSLAPRLLALRGWFEPFSLRLEYSVSAQLEESLTLIPLLRGIVPLDVFFQESPRCLWLLRGEGGLA